MSILTRIAKAVRKLFAKKVEKEKITSKEYFRRLMEEGPQCPGNFEITP